MHYHIHDLKLSSIIIFRKFNQKMTDVLCLYILFLTFLLFIRYEPVIVYNALGYCAVCMSSAVLTVRKSEYTCTRANKQSENRVLITHI